MSQCIRFGTYWYLLLMPVTDAYADISNGAIDFNFGLSLNLYPYFVYVINEGPGKSA